MDHDREGVEPPASEAPGGPGPEADHDDGEHRDADHGAAEHGGDGDRVDTEGGRPRHDQEGEVSDDDFFPSAGGSALPPKIEAWRKRSAAGAILTGFALGLQEALESRKEQPSIVMQTSGDPPEDLPVEADFEYGRPRQSVVQIRPWLLGEGAEAAGAADAAGETAAGAAGAAGETAAGAPDAKAHDDRREPESQPADDDRRDGR